MPASALFARLRARRAGVPVLIAPGVAMDGPELADASERFAAKLVAQGTRVFASCLDNGPAWVVADLGALYAGVVHVPLPTFFTPAQRAHALAATGTNTLLGREMPAGFDAVPCRTLDPALRFGRRRVAPVALPEGTVKITFTSGTTGMPKGVCLGAQSMLDVAAGLADALAPLRIERHLAALPFPVLLENLAGLYAPLWQGSVVITPPLRDVGLTGSSTFDAGRLDAAVRTWRANSVITLPQMLRAWTGHRANTAGVSDALRFVAVGGAPGGVALILAARAAGLPAYEGYGLSEGASVQTLNLPGADQPGSVGRPLPHARLRVTAEGEVEIGGTMMLGYVGDAAPPPAWWATGDLGEMDRDGHLHIRGRKKHVLITGFGRNVSPEWVETALRAHPAVLQAVVFGEGAPALSAVLWPTQETLPDTALADAVTAANETLPDYARIAHWVRALRPFTPGAGTATANGRPLRAAILEFHAAPLAASTQGLPMSSFHQKLEAETSTARATLVGAPIIQGTLRGEVSIESYVAFLTEAYHHVKHTVPLLRACRDRLPARLDWMRPALDEYIAEESGHDEWILADIAACGADANGIRGGTPAPATELMVAYAYDTIQRGNPVGFLGMVYVLEGTSVALALMAADHIQRGLALPDDAFTYLRSHGTLDQEHTKHLAQLLNALDDPADRDAVQHAATMFFRLYGDIFRSLPRPALQREAA